MPVRRIPYPFNHFRGENNVDGATDQAIFGNRGQRKLALMRGYQLIGWGRAKKRYGYKTYVAQQINGDVPAQGAAVHKKGATYSYVGVAGTAIKALDKANERWIDISGTATLTEDAGLIWSWGRFNDGTDQWLLGSNATDEPILWDGNTANSVRTLRSFDGSLQAADVANVVGFDTFHGYPLMLTYGGLRHAAYGTLNFGGGETVDASRGSRPLALHRHSKDVMLLFYDEEIFRLEFNPLEGSTWRALPVEDSEPCVSRASIITKDGVTYYAGDRGIHAIRKAHGPSEFIGREIETFWQLCNQSRRFNVTKLDRGAPWNEVMWLVSYGDSTTHNALIVWNTQMKGFTIFPPSQTSGKMEFNCGASWPDANGIPRTIVLGYDGVPYEAFGHKLANSSWTDDGALVRTELETGFLDYGWPGVSYTRQLILDIEASTGITFTLTATPISKAPLQRAFKVTAGGAELDVGFVLDESTLAEFTTTQADTKVDRDARYMKINLVESSDGTPHVIDGFHLPHKNGGMRMTA